MTRHLDALHPAHATLDLTFHPSRAAAIYALGTRFRWEEGVKDVVWVRGEGVGALANANFI